MGLVKANPRCYKRPVTDQTRECPMCGESMRIKDRDDVQIVPGTHQQIVRHVREWICPECDYFEEVDDDNAPQP